MITNPRLSSIYSITGESVISPLVTTPLVRPLGLVRGWLTFSCFFYPPNAVFDPNTYTYILRLQASLKMCLDSSFCKIRLGLG